MNTIPLPIWEAIKWIAIVSCFGFWIKHFVDYMITDEREVEESRKKEVKDKVRKYVKRVLPNYEG